MAVFKSKSPSVDTSHIHGSVSESALEHVHEFGDRTALIDSYTGERLTYHQLKLQAVKYALVLKNLGVKKGDVVSVVGENSIQVAALYFGIFYSGATVHPMYCRYKTDEMRVFLEDTRPSVIFTLSKVLLQINEALKDLAFARPRIITLDNSVKYDTCEALLNNVNDDDVRDFSPADVNSREDTAVFLFTSGTTGRPKCVMVSHFGIIANSMQHTSDPSLTLLEGFHVHCLIAFTMFHGLAALVLSFIFRKGGTLVIGPSLSECTADVMSNLIEKYKVNMILSAPSTLHNFVESTETGRYELTSLKRWITTGTGLSQNTAQEAMSKFGLNVSQQFALYVLFNESNKNQRIWSGRLFESTYLPALTDFGMTELLGTAIILTDEPNKHIESSLLPNIEAKVIDVSTGELLDANEQGEVCFKTPAMMMGYLNAPEMTKACIDEDGFLHTGDLGYFDDVGVLHIQGRLKELLVQEGHKFSPMELEELLLLHPSVADVAVIGLPQENGNDLIQAWVLKHLGSETSAEELRQFVAARKIAFKHLTGGVVFTDEIPRTASGKLLRQVLRDQALHKSAHK